MAQVVVRNLEEPVKQQLKALAASHGHSMEEEVRRIIRRAVATIPVTPAPSVVPEGIGTRLARRQRELGVTREDVDALERNIAELRGDWRMRDVGPKS